MAKITIEVDDSPVDAEIGDVTILFRPESQVDASWLVDAADEIAKALAKLVEDGHDSDAEGQREAIRQTREFLASLALDEQNATLCREIVLSPKALNALVDGVVGEYAGRPTVRSSDLSRRPPATRKGGSSSRGR